MLEKTAIVILAEFEMTMQEFQNHMFKPHLKVFLRLSLHSSFIFLYFVLEFLTKNYPSWCAARGVKYVAATLELEVYYSQACREGGGNHANQHTYIHTQDRRKV